MYTSFLGYENLLAIPVLFVIGCFAGFLSGLFGIGGGIITTPGLCMVGLAVNVASSTNLIQVCFSSLVNVTSRFKEGEINFKIAFIVIFFAAIGNLFGVKSIVFIKSIGYADLFISLFYITVMIVLASINFTDAVKLKKHPEQHIIALPSKLKLFVLTPLCAIFAGFLMPIMGIGGGFIVVPFFIKVLKFNKNQAVCTSAFQMLITSIITIVIGYGHGMVFDFIVALCVMPGSFFAVKFGAKISKLIKEYDFRIYLGVLMLTVATFFATKVIQLI